MRRREFLSLVGGGLSVWPLYVRAQETRRLVVLFVPLTKNYKGLQRRRIAFKAAMAKLGWVEGKNVRYEWREAPSGGGDTTRVEKLAKELVQLAPDVILVIGTPLTVALHRETKTVPIVFTLVADPVAAGLVSSPARPGGNITGFPAFYPEMVGKWVQTLKEIAPHIKRAALLFNPRTASFGSSDFLRPLFESVARQVAIEPIMAPVDDAGQIKAPIESLAHTKGGLVVMPDAWLFKHSAIIIESAAHHHVPAVYPWGDFAVRGGLIAYGPELMDIFLRSTNYLDRILRGEKPADLPVQLPTKFELVINLKTAKALGLAVPPKLLVRAHKVIE